MNDVESREQPIAVEGLNHRTGGVNGHEDLHDAIVAALKDIYDPEIPVNIYDLGLVYRVDIDADANAYIEMTLTAPGCPVAQTFPGTVESAVCQVPGVASAMVELVWDPPWTQERMTEAARLELGFF